MVGWQQKSIPMHKWNSSRLTALWWYSLDYTSRNTLLLLSFGTNTVNTMSDSNYSGLRIQELVIYEMHKILWAWVTNTSHIPLLTQWSLVKYCFQSKIFIASKKCCLFFFKICWIIFFYLTTVYVQFIHKICNLWYARRTKKLIGIAFYRLSHTIAMDSVWLIHITDDCNCNILSSVFPLTEPFNWSSRKRRRFFSRTNWKK